MSETPFRYKQCIVLRADLGMSVGKLISQACHAVVEASEEAKRRKPRIWRRWRNEGAKKVVLRVESLEELMELAERAEELGIVNVIIRDRGLTEVPPGTITALGLGPDLSERMDRVTGHLRLFR